MSSSTISLQNRKYKKELLNILDTYDNCDNKQFIINVIEIVGVFSTYMGNVIEYNKTTNKTITKRSTLNLRYYYIKLIENINNSENFEKYSNDLFYQIERKYDSAQMREIKLKLLLKC